ncbi:lipid-A-disaccharide synthase [Ponticaulis sp.]|uniref:lipid-A-disaccharide synthase n=1 Tax=Ponticaulis sp. TaxID=2020902 RepID=UPI0026260C9D|nr:lipid-A-disaccharide synthase [Ponticaulis sp.]MDF1681522.1 lipid-A-disaccharide synthase [Ponticaulis sp.]
MSCDLIFVSAEPSGDDLSVGVIQSLRTKLPNLEIKAIGGNALETVELSSPIDVSPLSVLGLFEGLKVYPQVVKLADAAADFIVRNDPKAVVLVDSWGFMLRVAQRLKKRAPHIKLIKLVGPQVWATRPGRAKTLAKLVDHLLCIHEMEVPYYEPFGLPCTVIGNPALDRLEPGDGEAYRTELGLADDQRLLLILPGSRKSEISRTAPTLAAAATRLVQRFGPNLKPVVLVSKSVAELVQDGTLPWPVDTHYETRVDAKADLMSAADVALACSGTVTTELASQGCPMVVAYRMGPLTWFLADKFLYQPDYATLFNIAADKEVAPEFLQDQLTAKNLSHAVSELLMNDQKRANQIHEQFEALERMGLGGKPAPEIAADTLIDLIK